MGISGIDCAGKSTLAESLRGRLEAVGEAVLVVSGDEFTRPTIERFAESDDGPAYYRDSFDYRFLFESLLPAVRDARASELFGPVSDWERDAWWLPPVCDRVERHRARRRLLPLHPVA